MNIDAYDDMVRQEQNQRYVGIKNATPEYIPGYDPDNDPLYHIADKPHYSADLYVASQNYWAGKTGQTSPPPPDYRMYHGRLRLGRLLDVYGCQCHMRAAKHNWQSFWWGGVLLAVAMLFVGVELGILDIFAIPILLVVWFSVKTRYHSTYRRYYNTQKLILQSGEPVWLPYERTRLRWIKRNAFYVWP